jgi:hypothetical protein
MSSYLYNAPGSSAASPRYNVYVPPSTVSSTPRSDRIKRSNSCSAPSTPAASYYALYPSSYAKENCSIRQVDTSRRYQRSSSRKVREPGMSPSRLPARHVNNALSRAKLLRLGRAIQPFQRLHDERFVFAPKPVHVGRQAAQVVLPAITLGGQARSLSRSATGCTPAAHAQAKPHMARRRLQKYTSRL